MAQATSAAAPPTEAKGAVVIDRAVGTSIAFDVATQTLSAVFLTGGVGDSVSLAGRAGAVGSLVLSTGSWRIGLLRRTTAAGGTVGPFTQTDGSGLLLLAQFN